MSNKIRKLNLAIFLLPEVLSFILIIAFLFLKKNVTVIAIIIGIETLFYIVFFIGFFKVMPLVDKYNKKVLGENPDNSLLVSVSPFQMMSLIKKEAIVDPNSEKVISISDISEVK